MDTRRTLAQFRTSSIGAVTMLITLAASASAALPERLSALPDRLEAERERLGVTGASVAVVSDCRIAWTLGFGMTSKSGGEPVVPTTTFEGASLGKPIAALSVLASAERFGLNLEAPVTGLGIEPPARAARVTASELMSHTAGLSNRIWPLDRVIHQEPGTRFGYSGVGFELLQQWLSNQSHQDPERIAQMAVFEPLGMKSSSYVRASTDLARAQVRLWRLAMIGAPLLYGIGAVLVFGALVVDRFRRKRWMLAPAISAVLGAVACTATFFTLVGALGSGAAILVVLAGALPILLAAVGILGLGFVMGRNYPVVARWVGGALGLGAFLLLSGTDESVPPSPPGREHFAYSLKTTAPDLGRFIVALMAPPPELAPAVSEMIEPVVRIDAQNQWGRGIGIRTTQSGERVLWQWGANLGFQGLLVAVPARCEGVAVLTNSERGAAFAAYAVQEVLGLPGPWRAN